MSLVLQIEVRTMSPRESFKIDKNDPDLKTFE